VPAVVRWPGIVKPGTIINDIIGSEDWQPTFLATAGNPNVKEELLKGMKVGDKTFKNHLDGYNFLQCRRREAAAAASETELVRFIGSGNGDGERKRGRS
jgi:arylsulfatase A-like enzyme